MNHSVRFRIDLEISDLVNDMLDQIPEHVFKSTDSTFLDPAFAGGQFLYGVASRLMQYGHSKENILSRLYGFEYAPVYMNSFKIQGLAGANLELVNTYEEFLSMTTKKKFDVVLGNPPYQDKNQGLWQLFARKSIDLLKDGGYLSFVTPNSWANGSHLNTDRNVFNSILQRYNCVEIKTNVNKHFPGIGKNISTWTISKEPHSGLTTVVDRNDVSKKIDISQYPFFINVFSFEALEIFQKVLEHGNFYSEFVEKKNTSERCYAFPKIRHNAGYRKGYIYDGINVDFPTSPVVVGIDCSNKTLDQVESIHSQFQSNLFKFLWKIYGADDAGSFGWILRNMPKLPDDRIYSNHDVYSELNLTEFAEYIDEYVG